MKLIWSTPALRDLQEVFEYIGMENKAAARHVVRHIKSSAALLQNTPLIGRRGSREGTRELVISKYPYVLMYSVGRDRVEIERVIHTSRMWPD